MRERIIIESSTLEGVMSILQSLEGSFAHVSATTPVETHDGRFIASVLVSTETRTLDTNVDRL